jgi:hypothetical protein
VTAQIRLGEKDATGDSSRSSVRVKLDTD